MMKRLSQIIDFLKKIIKWYREPIPGYRLLRVDPILVLAVIGISTTMWSVMRGLAVESLGNDLANGLRDAPAKMTTAINDSYNANRISGFDREVALQRLDMMRPIFNQYADIIQSQGYETGNNALAVGIFESLMSLGPAEAGGRLVGALTTGKGIDRVVALACIGNTVKDFELVATPFSTQEQQLRVRLEEIFKMDKDTLFKARMRAKINYLQREWTDRLKENPCQPEQLVEDYRNWAYGRAKNWAEYPRLYGAGQRWETYDAYLDWLIEQVRAEDGKSTIQNYEGNFTVTNTALVGCKACTPPSLSGTIQLAVNMENCSVSGKITGEGVGEVTINLCNSKREPIDEKCTASGQMNISGDISGIVDHTSGKLTLNPTTVTLNHTWQWTECTSLTGGSEYSGEDTIGITGGFTSIQSLTDGLSKMSGSLEWGSDVCQLKGTWEAGRK